VTDIELERLVVRLIGDSTSYQKMIDSAISETRRAGQLMQAESRRVDQYAISINTLGETVGNLAAQFRALPALEPPLGVFQEGIHIAAEVEKNAAAFGVMLQSKQKGLKLEQEIIKFGAETPLQALGIQQAAKMLLQFGAVTEDTVIPTLRILGDVTGGDQQRLMQMSLAFGQASATGRLMGQDLNQMINAGFNPLSEMARTSGKTIEELKDEMEKGRITIDRVKDAFRTATSEGGSFKGGMLEASKTFEGLFSTMQDDISAAKREIGQFIIEQFELKNVLREVSAQAQLFTKNFHQMHPIIKDVGIAVAVSAASLGAFVVVWKVSQVTLLMGIGTLANMRTTIWSTIAATKWFIAAMRGQTVAQVQATAGLAQMAGVQYNVSAAMQTATLRARVLSGAMLGLKLAMAGVVAYSAVKIAEFSPANQRRLQGYQQALEEVQRTEQARTTEEAERAQSFMTTLPGMSKENKKQALEKEIYSRTNIMGEEAGTLKSRIDVENAEKRLAELKGRTIAMISKILPGETKIEAMIKEQEEALKGANERYAQEVEYVQKLKDELEKLKDPAKDPALVKAIKDYNEQLEMQAMTFGMTNDEIKIYELRHHGATDAMLANTIALQAQIRDLEQQKKAEEMSSKAMSDAQDQLDSMTNSLQKEIDTIGMTAEETALYNLQLLGLDESMTAYYKTMLEVKRTSEEHNKALQEGKDLTERYLNPVEKFARETQKLDRLMAEGAISQEIYDRAIKDAAESFNKAETGARGARREIERLDGVLAGGAEARFRVASFIEGNRRGGVQRQGESLALQEKLAMSGRSNLSAKDGGDELLELKKIKSLLSSQKKNQVVVAAAGLNN